MSFPKGKYCLRTSRARQNQESAAEQRGRYSPVLGPRGGGLCKWEVSRLNSGSPLLGGDMAMEWEGRRPAEATSRLRLSSRMPQWPHLTPSPTSCLVAIHFLSFPLHFPLLSLSSLALLPVSPPRVKRAGSLSPVGPQFPHL